MSDHRTERDMHATAPENPQNGDRLDCPACDYVAEFVVLDDGLPGEWVDITPLADPTSRPGDATCETCHTSPAELIHGRILCPTCAEETP